MTRRADFLEPYNPGMVEYDEIDSTDHPLHSRPCDLCGHHKTRGHVFITVYATAAHGSRIRMCRTCLEAMLDEAPPDTSARKLAAIAEGSPLARWIRSSA